MQSVRCNKEGYKNLDVTIDITSGWWYSTDNKM